MLLPANFTFKLCVCQFTIMFCIFSNLTIKSFTIFETYSNIMALQSICALYLQFHLHCIWNKYQDFCYIVNVSLKPGVLKFSEVRDVMFYLLNYWAESYALHSTHRMDQLGGKILEPTWSEADKANWSSNWNKFLTLWTHEQCMNSLPLSRRFFEIT